LWVTAGCDNNPADDDGKWAWLGYRSALNSTRRDIEGPGKDERNRETGQDEDDQTQTPVWQVPGRKNRRGDLNDDAARDDVGTATQ